MLLSPVAYVGVSIAVGLSFGILLQKARFCFVSAFRDFVAFKDTRVLKGLLVGIAVMTVFWSVQATFGYFRGFWTPAWGSDRCSAGSSSGSRDDPRRRLRVRDPLPRGTGVPPVLARPPVHVRRLRPLRVRVPRGRDVLLPDALNPFEGQTLYLSLPFSPAVIGVGAVALGTLAYAFVKGRSQLPDDPSGGTGVGTDPARQAAIGASRTLSAVSLGLRGIADGTVEYGRALASDDRPVTVRLRDSWDARTAGVAMALVASLWFYVHGHWAITGSEARWAGYLLAGAGFDVASVDYWGRSCSATATSR